MNHPSLNYIRPSKTTKTKPHVYPNPERYSQTAGELLYRSRCFVDALNSRSFKKFMQLVGPEHISQDFTAYLDNQALAFTWTEFVSTLEAAAKADPNYQVDIIDQSVDLDEIGGHAVVFIMVEVAGRPISVRREDALIFEWKRHDGIWKCYGHTSIRGSGGIPLKDRG